MALTPQERVWRSRLGAHLSWSRTPDRAARTAPARKAALDRFVRLVDPRGELTPEERSRRAAQARRSYFKALALKSVEARRRAGKLRQ